MKSINKAFLDTMVARYLETALWSSTEVDAAGGMGDPLHEHYGINDIDAASRAQAVNDCADFLSLAVTYFTDAEWDAEAIGHNFWLNRNRHGAGFWDGGYEQGDALSDLAKTFASLDARVYDGKVALS